MEYNLKQAIDAKRLEMLRGLKEHHIELLRSVDIPVDNLDDLEHGLDKAALEDWEDIAWYQGFLSALRWMKYDAAKK